MRRNKDRREFTRRLAIGVAAAALVTSAIAVTSALAGFGAATQEVVRLYDVRITASTHTGSVDLFQSCNKRVTTDARHTWSSFHRSVPFQFRRRAGLLLLSSAVQPGSMTGAVSYTDNGYGCNVPPCRVSLKGVAPATFTVLPTARSGRQTSMHFVVRGGLSFRQDKCVDEFDQPLYGPTFDGPGGVDVTRRRPGSSHRVTSSSTNGTSVQTYSSARPTTPAKLAYPLNVIYAGKPVTIRVVDAHDETKLNESLNGVVTITMTPRRSG
jgi:hypothetical protein